MAAQPDRPGAQHRRGRRPPSRAATSRARSPSTSRARSSSSRTPSTRWSTSSTPSPREVTRVAREVGTEGKLGGQAQVPGVAGTWKDLTDNVNLHGRQPDRPGAQHRRGRDRDRQAATCRRRSPSTSAARSSQLKDTINTMVDQLNAFAAEVTRVAREVGTEGKLGGQAQVPGVAGTWKDLTDNVNSMASNLTAQVRNIAEVDDRRRARRPVAQDHGRRQGRDPRAQEHHQHDGRPAQRVRRRGDARGARGRHRGQARRPGAGARRRRHLEGPHRQRQLHGRRT